MTIFRTPNSTINLEDESRERNQSRLPPPRLLRTQNEDALRRGNAEMIRTGGNFCILLWHPPRPYRWRGHLIIARWNIYISCTLRPVGRTYDDQKTQWWWSSKNYSTCHLRVANGPGFSAMSHIGVVCSRFGSRRWWRLTNFQYHLVQWTQRTISEGFKHWTETINTHRALNYRRTQNLLPLFSSGWFSISFIILELLMCVWVVTGSS